ncbi:MAG: hypothetical protein M3R13_07615 [Armatimonadota bacterium]|nr:hypothetical protein [Armatimonadota bacterium]
MSIGGRPNVLALTLAFFLIGQPDSLLAKAEVIASTENWAGGMVSVPDYEWIGQTGLIYYRKEDEDTYSVMEYDTRARKSKLLPALTRTYNKDGSGVGDLDRSPDGKLFLSGRYGGTPVFYLTDINGREHGSWPIREMNPNHHDTTGRTEAVWTPDSKAIIDATVSHWEQGFEVHARQRSVSKPSDENVLPLARFPVSSQWNYPQAIGPGMRAMLVYIKNLGMWKGDMKLPESAVVLAWLAWYPRVWAQYDVAFPGKSRVHDWQFSPDGDQILWETCSLSGDSSEWPVGSDGRVLGERFIGLWISRWDGRNMRLLGRLPLTDGDEGMDMQRFGWIRFVPGARSVSFVFDHRLYVLDLP